MNILLRRNPLFRMNQDVYNFTFPHIFEVYFRDLLFLGISEKVYFRHFNKTTNQIAEMNII